MAAAGVRTTKGLYFTFTLLCLVCLASSLIDKEKLEKLKESVQRSQQLLDRAKAEYESQMAISERRLDEIMNMEEQDEIVKGIKERAKIYHEMVKETLNAEIGVAYAQLREIKTFIEFLEETQAEL